MTLHDPIQESKSVRAPRISVIIPTRHRNDLLTLCLERLRPETQQLSAGDYEIIVSDDGADSTAEALIQERFSFARWTPGPRRGPAANRNSGVRSARGEWLAFTDDDCLPCDRWLATYQEAIDTWPDCPIFEGQTICSAGPLTSPLEDAPINLTGGWLWSCNFAIRRDAYEAVGGFDEIYPIAFMEDADLRERLLRQGLKSRFLPRAIVDHPIKRYSLQSDMRRYAESEAIYWYRQGKPGPLRGPFFRGLVRSRIGSLKRGLRRPGRDTAVATILVFRELWHAATHLSAWEERYRPRKA